MFWTRFSGWAGLLIAAGVAALPAPALAKWREASSQHFVIYADDSEKDLRRFSEKLERFHSAMEIVTKSKTEVPSPSNRLTVYVVDSTRDVRKLYGDGNRYIAGFFTPSAGGSLAIVPEVQNGGREVDEAMLTLLHEYAHYFVAISSAFPIPRWVSEGGAEFFASASFDSDGTVGIGRPAVHRAYELFYAKNVSLEELFDDDLYQSNKGRRYDAYYGRAWLLYHYLVLNADRRPQLTRYFDMLIQGTPSLEAARESFGDFDTLDDELDDYLKQRRMNYFQLQPDALSVGEIAVSELSEGAAAIMPVRIRSKRGVSEEEAILVLADAREIAASYPDDPFVQATLAEAEFDAGNDAQAIAAADAALAADPANVDAYVQKGYALFRIAEDADDYEKAYKDAFAPFSALNRLENDHPLPLIYFYRSYAAQGKKPTETAVQALERAAELAPFDLGLRMTLAMDQIQRGELAKARINLEPIAHSPHPTGSTRPAQALLRRIESSDQPVSSQELSIILTASDVMDLGEDGGDDDGESK